MHLTQCFVDESVYDDLGIVVTVLVFGDADVEAKVTATLRKSGIDSPREEFKSSARIDSDTRMPKARDALLALAGGVSKVAVFFGPFSRPRLGRKALQAAQSVVLRNANAINRKKVSIYVDRGVFASQMEADRLHALFNFLKSCRISAVEDSKVRVGVQVADCIAHSFGQIIKTVN